MFKHLVKKCVCKCLLLRKRSTVNPKRGICAPFSAGALLAHGQKRRRLWSRRYMIRYRHGEKKVCDVMLKNHETVTVKVEKI